MLCNHPKGEHFLQSKCPFCSHWHWQARSLLTPPNLLQSFLCSPACSSAKFDLCDISFERHSHVQEYRNSSAEEKWFSKRKQGSSEGSRGRKLAQRRANVASECFKNFPAFISQDAKQVNMKILALQIRDGVGVRPIAACKAFSGVIR